MPSGKILRHAIERIAEVRFNIIAPQHGSIIHKKEDVLTLCEKLLSLDFVGIDGIIQNHAVCELGDTSCLRKMAVEDGR